MWKKYNKSVYHCFWCICLLIICIAGSAGVTSGKSVARKHVLLISSYFPDKANSSLIINAFSRQLNSETDCRITVEYMDSESTTDFEKWKCWMEQLFEAYNSLPDVVVIIGGEAWSAYAVSCPSSWKQVPVVLGAVKQGYIDYAHIDPRNIHSIKEIHNTAESFGDYRVTGYYTEDYFRENMELIRGLQPEVRRIAYIYDNRYGFCFLTPYLRNLARKAGFEDLQTFYGRELTTMQLVDSLLAQDSTYAILSSGWYTDALHYAHAYSMLHNELALWHSKYFYLLMDQGMTNPNYLGGYYVSAGNIGKDLAGLTYTVLTQGIERSPRFQPTPSKPAFHVNYKTLLSSGIRERALPAGTVIYNREPSFWRTYFWQLLLVLSVFVTVVLSLYLRMLYYRRVTAVKARMMEEQKSLREKADESNRLKSAFLANMSHEIRTPLNAIVGFSDLLIRSEDQEEGKQYAAIIDTNCELLLQLVNDILDLSKIEAGQLDFAYSGTDVVEVCHHLQQIYQKRVNEGVELRCEVPDQECIIDTDRNRLTQVISNFLSNAVKFTTRGMIRFGYEHRGDSLYFFTEDTGKGIAPENLPRVFLRFEKLDHFVQGNGLGMSICKGIVEKMGGCIGLDSEPGKGSRFWFTLPVKRNSGSSES